MAGRDTTTIAPGVKRTDCFWGYYLEGKKEDLIRAGLAQERWFLDGKVRCESGQATRTTHFVQSGQMIECTQPKHGKSMVSFTPVSPEELKRWERLEVVSCDDAKIPGDTGRRESDLNFQRFMQIAAGLPITGLSRAK